MGSCRGHEHEELTELAKRLEDFSPVPDLTARLEAEYFAAEADLRPETCADDSPPIVGGDPVARWLAGPVDAPLTDAELALLRAWLHQPENRRDAGETQAGIPYRYAKLELLRDFNKELRKATPPAPPAATSTPETAAPSAPGPERSEGKAGGEATKRRGRKPDTDTKEDKRIFDAMKTGHFLTYEDLGRALRKTGREIKAAIDRHRHRKTPSTRRKK